MSVRRVATRRGARPGGVPARRPRRLRRVDVLIAGALFLLLVAVSVTAPRWAALLREPLEAEGAAADVPVEGPAPGATGAGEAERRIRVKLFLGHPDQPALAEEERSVPFSRDLPQQLRLVLEALVLGSEGELLPVLPPETKVLDVFLRGGVAYVNLSAEASTEHEGGAAAELLSVYAIVDTIVTNFPAVRRVQIVVDGGASPTLAGHIDVSRPLGGDLSLLAPLLPPAEAPPDSPPPGPS